MQSSEMTFCPICGKQADRFPTLATSHRFHCKVCGDYEVGFIISSWLPNAQKDGTLSDAQRKLVPYLSCHTRQANGTAKVTNDNWESLAKPHRDSPLEEKYRKMLAYMLSKSNHVGEPLDIEDDDYPLFDTGSVYEKDALASEALSEGYLKGEFPMWVLSKKGREFLTNKPVEHRVFVSHAASDATLAERIAQTLREKLPGVEVFVSSEPGSIPTGEKWLKFVEEKLINASAYVILLTPTSFNRPWLWFETGSVWFRKDRRIFGLCAGLDKVEVLYPLGALQVKSLDDPADIRVVMNELGAACDDKDAERLLMFFKTDNPTIQEHVTIGENHYVWAGALDALEDRQPTHPPADLQKTLEGQGFVFRCGLPDKSTHWGKKGFFPLYVSDRAKWKRALVCPTSPEQIVFVKPPAQS